MADLSQTQNQSHTAWNDPPKLVYQYTGHTGIRGLAWLPNRTLAILSYDEKIRNEDGTMTYANKQLCALDPSGKTTQLPFTTTHLTSPRRLCSNHDGTVLAITDRLGHGRCSVVVNKLIDGAWVSSSFNTTMDVHSVALSPSGDLVCCNGDKELVRLSSTGEVRWTKPLPGDGRLPPYLAIDLMDRLTVSNVNVDQLTVLDSQGRQKTEFSLQLLKEPTGVTVTSEGNILVADEQSCTISLYTAEGNLIKKVLSMDYKPYNIDLIDNKYLSVRAYNTQIYVYELC